MAGANRLYAFGGRVWCPFLYLHAQATGGYAALQRFSARDSSSEELCKVEPLHGVC